MSRKEKDRSRVVFGSEKRLSILAAIAYVEEDDCFPARVAELSGAPASAVSVLMKKLCEVELLEVLESRRGDNARRHRKLDSALWNAVTRFQQESSD